MSDKRNDTRPAAKAITGTDASKLSPKERHALWTKSKIERAGQDDTNIISAKTKNLSDYVNLLNINDKLMSDCLLSFGSNPRVTFALLEDIKQRTIAAKEMINAANAALCHAMQWTYRPPRGFVDPLAKQAQQARNAAKKSTPKPQQPQPEKKAAPVAVVPAQPAKVAGPKIVPPKSAAVVKPAETTEMAEAA